MTLRRRIAIALSALLAVAITGFALSIASMWLCMPDAPASMRVSAIPARPVDPAKPLVVVLLGDTQSDVTDVLGPYAMFSEAGTYEVRTIASSSGVRTLSGGLEVVPDLTFASLARLRPRGADIVVVPAILEIETAKNSAVRAWLARQARTDRLLFSWCTGAEVLAASHVLDGKRATAHWADLGRIEAAYPRVRWERGLRFVDEGAVLSSGGLTFGIDATLHVLRQRDGEAVARRVATAIRLPHEARDPRVTQTSPELSDVLYFLDAAFYWPKRSTGVYLYDGVNELDLAAIFDVFPASFTDVMHTFAEGATVRTEHGLVLAARRDTRDVERVLLPRGEPRPSEDAVMEALEVMHVEAPVEPMPPGVYAFRAAVEDLGARDGRAVARFAARRLELRTPWQRSRGLAFPLRLLLIPTLVTLLVGALASARFRSLFKRQSPPR